MVIVIVIVIVIVLLLLIITITITITIHNKHARKKKPQVQKNNGCKNRPSLIKCSQRSLLFQGLGSSPLPQKKKEANTTKFEVKTSGPQTRKSRTFSHCHPMPECNNGGKQNKV